MPNLELVPVKKLSPFRRVAIGTWRTAYDPSVYGSLDIRMEKALEYMAAFRRHTGKRVTVTHLVTKAVGEALAATPEANAILRFNRIYLRQSVDISILVVQTDLGDGKTDLAACKVDQVDKKSLYQLVTEVEEQVARVRARKDKAMEKSKATTNRIPLLFINWFLDLLSFLLYTLNLDLRFLGMPRDPFGGATVTNVGSLGLDTAYVPLVPYSRVPIFVAPGAIKDQPVVEDGQVVPGKVMRVNATFDHRFIDGFHAGRLAHQLRDMLENPFERFDDIASLPRSQESGDQQGADHGAS